MGGFIYQVYTRYIPLFLFHGSGMGKTLIGVVWGMYGSGIGKILIGVVWGM